MPLQTRSKSHPYPIEVENTVVVEKRIGENYSEAPTSVWRMLAEFHDCASKALHVAPQLALGVPIFLVFLSLSAFLEVYILDNASSFLAIFAVGSYIVFSSYFVADHYMSRISTSYASIPDDKKFYVLSNLIKSAVLLAYSPSCAVTLYNACLHDVWSTPRIRAMGVLYAIPDAVSLLLVTRMATSTKVHHLCVVLFMVVNLFVTYEHETIGRALVVYAVFSTFAYLVNLLLASRFLPIHPAVSLILSGLALVIYAGCLGVNWTWQLWFLNKLAFSGPSWLHIAGISTYLLLISQVVKDDVVLVAWLYKNAHKAVAECGTPSPKKQRKEK